MTPWAWFWTVVLAVSCLLFAGLVLVVAIGGFGDVIAMFRNLDRQHESEDSHESGANHPR